MSKNYQKIAEQYALDLVSGSIPAAKITRKACQRHLDDLVKAKDPSYPYDFNPVLVDGKGREYKPADRICQFAERLKHVKGEWKGKNIVLEPWQVFFLAVVFGWIRRDNGKRRFREVYAEIPRKNGKSILGAIIGLFMFCVDGEGGSEVYSGATTEKQAWEVFRPARLMAKGNENFQKAYSVEVHAKDLTTTNDYSRFEPLIGNPGDGASPHCALIDEFHEHKSPEQFDTMDTGMGARSQPLLCAITTAGTNLAGPCYTKRCQVVKVLEGVFENNELFGLIYTTDKDDDWTDLAVWKKANPNYGISVYADYLERKLKNAIQDASKQNITQCKHLNKWMNAGEAFFNMVDLEKCSDPSLRIEDFAGEQCWPGIDIASKTDLATMGIVFKREIGADVHYYAFLKSYLPSKALIGEDKSHYQGWEKEGWLTVTPGSRVDIDQIEKDLEDVARAHEVVEVPHDPWNAAQFAGHMLEKDIEMVEVPQSVASFSGPTKELDALIQDGKFHYDGNPILKWCISNVVARYDKKDNVFPYKERPEQKIDGAISIIMSIGRAMLYAGNKSVYEERGVRTA